MKPPQQNNIINILLADDDRDDRYFFDKALKGLPFPTHLTTVEDGEQLLAFLNERYEKLPDVLFLDMNMPRRNGSECLAEIKGNPKLKNLPVIIYSTALHEAVADVLYKAGAHYYVRKTDFDELKKTLLRVMELLIEKEFERPPRNEFIVGLVGV